MTTNHLTCRLALRLLFTRSTLAAIIFVALGSSSLPACVQTDTDQRIPDRLRRVPEWARDAVWYQIFPERFRNGDPENDPMVEDVVLSYPFNRPADWRVSTWTGDWYALQPWEKATGKTFYEIVHQRRYGGDLQGVLDKLDYLKDLGVTALYFNPLFESPSLHKYDATMYHHIDNNFGPDPAGDARMWASERPDDPATWQWTSADRLFLKLIEEAHHRGMRVIIDGVFNHVGTTFWAFRDLRAHGKASPYHDWFTVTSWDDPATPADEFDYRGWIGLKDLPEFREDGNGIVAGPREHIHSVVKRWMDPNGDGDPADGIDGWRLDVAEMVAVPFWRLFRQWTRDINPDSYLTGEVWWEDWDGNKMFNAEPWLRGDVFDAVMNYRWAAEAMHFFRDRNLKITASELVARLDALRADYRTDVNAVLMNLYASHDTDRLGSMMVNIDMLFDHRVGARDNPAYDVRKPSAEEIRRQKLLVLFQMTYVGAPMVYYGEEAGMWGGDDPDERKPMVWPEMTYDPEISHPHETARPRDPVAFDTGLHEEYRALMRLRTAEPALRRGEYRVVLTNDAQDAFAFERALGADRLLVILNIGGETTLTIPVPGAAEGSRWRDLRTDEEFIARNATLAVPVHRVAGRVLKAGS